jgi:two-component SAPR family response regulator
LSIVNKYKVDAHWIDAYFFGIPRVAINDKDINEDSWVTMKSKKLFFYLLLNKDRKANHDVLIDALWPDSSYKNGSNNLRKALQHIKQPLKSFITNKDELIKSGRRFYQIPRDISVQLDVNEFQDLIKQAKNLKKQNKKYRRYLRKALSLYKDGFCTGWYESWVEDMRHFYTGLYEECLTMMADLAVSKKSNKEAITLYKKLLKLNFMNEEYHRKLMRVYSAVNKVKEIIKDFNQLKKTLKKELDSKPQQETIKLFNSLNH